MRPKFDVRCEEQVSLRILAGHVTLGNAMHGSPNIKAYK